MNEYVLIVRAYDKTETLLGVKPLYLSFIHLKPPKINNKKIINTHTALGNSVQ
jgi:hypothetical protein